RHGFTLVGRALVQLQSAAYFVKSRRHRFRRFGFEDGRIAQKRKNRRHRHLQSPDIFRPEAQPENQWLKSRPVQYPVSIYFEATVKSSGCSQYFLSCMDRVGANTGFIRFGSLSVQGVKNYKKALDAHSVSYQLY